MNSLEEFRKYTKVVADTGELEEIKLYKPVDATTNPSLLLKAATNPEYKYLVDQGVAAARDMDLFHPGRINLTLELLSVNFALEILSIIPGRVSIEVDPSLSFNTHMTIESARRIINYLEDRDINRNRVLVKISSTWEGIEAAKILEEEGIHCNLTLLFGFTQALAAADAGVSLISPFVGRIYDFYRLKRGVDFILPTEDPGVLSVKRIFNYYKKYGYKTEVMGASFRNIGEIKELTGCDLLTISPNLLKELENDIEGVVLKLDRDNPDCDDYKYHLSEDEFRWMLNEDEMATIKLAEGIRIFNNDWLKLSQYLLANYS